MDGDNPSLMRSWYLKTYDSGDSAEADYHGMMAWVKNR